MKSLSIFLVFVFLFSCTAPTVEEKSPIEGTWELVSGKWSREDTTQTFPISASDRALAIYGKTHVVCIMQDTSRTSSHFWASTYVYKGDSLIGSAIMYPYHKDIGHSITFKVEIEGDKMFITAADVNFYGFDWNSYYEEWKRID